MAEMIGEELTAKGIVADVRPARTCRALSGYSIVIVAGALYALRWHRDARRFVRKFTNDLRRLPVWLVASGPLDASARDGTLPAVRHVVQLMNRIAAKGEVTFGGRLTRDAKGLLAHAMAKTRSGDWRDREQVREFVARVAESMPARVP